jgi:hypothetical protein
MSGAQIAAPRTKLRRGFDLNQRRRIEIERHAIHVGAAETDDLCRWLIAWIWHNPGAKDQVGAVIECARRLGLDISPAEAREIIDEAKTIPPCRKADPLAAWLGLTYADRRKLHIRTIGSINVKKRARTELRKRSKRLAEERRRRTRGARSRAQYEGNSIAGNSTVGEIEHQPADLVSAAEAGSDHAPATVGTSPCPITFLIPKHRPVP